MIKEAFLKNAASFFLAPNLNVVLPDPPAPLVSLVDGAERCRGSLDVPGEVSP